MAQKDSRRLSVVVPYLYPNLVNSPEGDYHLQNDGDDTGTFVVWHNTEIPEPTTQQLADAKEDALNADWWRMLRLTRDGLLKDTDEYAITDRPDNADWLTYRQELRELPDNVTKPDFEIIENQSVTEWNMDGLMPTKPS
mgnify:CR=1 FL=1|tara:strand:- start:205 stop:621 length:417 start_codon:yes stop_codon:yes gene_type:complete